MNSDSGFSLIELIIVVAILALLSIIALQAFGTQQPKARDSKRLADIDFVYNYVEQYMSEEGEYPTHANFEALRSDFASLYLTRFGEVQDPGNLSYTYAPVGTGYCLCAQLERAANANSGASCNFSASVKDHYCRVNFQ